MTNTLTAEQKLEAAIHNAMIDTVHMDDDSENAWQKAVSAIALAVAPFVSPDLPSPPVSGEAWAMSEDQYDGVRDLIKRAYEQGANDVHQNYQEDVDPDFSEAAMDYGESVTQEFINLFPSIPLSPLTNDPVGQFDTSDYVIVGLDGRPRRNEPVADHIPDASKMVEPVGVTLPRDLAVLAQNVLFRNGFVSADDIEKAIKEYDARLSAAIGEPRRAALEGET